MEKGGRRKYIRERGLEEAPENGKESSHSAHDKGMNNTLTLCCIDTMTVVISDYCSTSCHSLAPILPSLLSAVCTLQLNSKRMDPAFMNIIMRHTNQLNN